MEITGEDTAPGTVLLVTAAPAGRSCLVDTGNVTNVLAAVAPGAWTGTAAASLVELADPIDPQTVLTRVRAAAATPGPLTVVLSGQLQRDRRQHHVHLALARTTPATVRYTALPWAWFVHELQQRRPGTTTVYADLVADAETWQHLHTAPLELGRGTHTYGLIAAPPKPRQTVQPAYTLALAQILRSGLRLAPERLHQEALQQVDTSGALVIGPARALDTAGYAPHPAAPAVGAATRAAVPDTVVPGRAAPDTAVPGPAVPGPVVPAQAPPGRDPHAEVFAAASAGRHTEAAGLAAAHEQEALRAHGPASPQAVHWIEVQAELARQAEDPARASQLWMRSAVLRLTSGQSPEHPDVTAAVDRAHHCWHHVTDPRTVHDLGAELAALRSQVTGKNGAREDVRRRLARIAPAPSG
ncbi:hypothetical protein GPA10_28655 [Streptomyces sp. p1417]|uniref:Uncharacterized protein n=1 Tax=Streptomyces typhae TaxID=2681492 RepID=A0A6L6X462_9ACTN|nr:hypothetical protein [Streptomyces typhae]